MKRLALCCLLLAVGLLCRSPLAAAGKKDGNAAGSAQTKKVPESTAPADETSAEPTKSGGTALSTGEGEKNAENDGTSSPAADTNGKDGENGEPADVTFASIHSKGLAVADGNKWYYEGFDRQGRSAFGVLYEDGAAIEKTVWTYQGAAHYPEQKKILRKESSEIFRYNEKGKELTIERYEGENLISKTENVYNTADKLIEQTITVGKNTDRSVWEFAGDKAVTQTKYRNGKKTAFIELHSTPHIVHLYVDDKEVYVGEKQ